MFQSPTTRSMTLWRKWSESVYIVIAASVAVVLSRWCLWCLAVRNLQNCLE